MTAQKLIWMLEIVLTPTEISKSKLSNAENLQDKMI